MNIVILVDFKNVIKRIKFESNYTFCKLSDTRSIVNDIIVRSEAVSDEITAEIMFYQ